MTSTAIILTLLYGMLGAALGSFANVCAVR